MFKGLSLGRNKGVVHKHVFLEDGRNPDNIGFSDHGLFTSESWTQPEVQKAYTVTRSRLDDGIVRLAIEIVAETGDYRLLGDSNNCQTYADAIEHVHDICQKEGITTVPEWTKSGHAVAAHLEEDESQPLLSGYRLGGTKT